MSDNIVILNCETTLDIPVERVLEGAVEDAGSFKNVLVITDTDGTIELRTSTGQKSEIIYMLEVTKAKILEHC